MNKNYLFLALGCAMLMTSCVKDDPNATFIKLFAEGYNPDQSAKAAVLDEKTYWVDGEKLLLNGRAYDIMVNTSGEAVIKNVTPTDNHLYRAIYPASVAKNTSGDNCTITIPQTHYYSESGGKQVIDRLPMIAYYSNADNDPEMLQFKHLTAAITVQVKNVRESDADRLELDRIELINSHYRLSGDINVNLANASPDSTLSVAPQKVEGGDTVVMIFYSHEKIVNKDETVDIQIPILPVGGSEDGGVNSTFTIKVTGHIQGSRYVFEKTTPARNNTILRAQLGYATTKFVTDSPASDLFDVQTEQTITVGEESVTKNFYEINSPDELITLAEALDAGYNTSSNDEKTYRTGNYILMNDIDLEGAEMVPIHYYNQGGGERVYFYGNNKTIKNFVTTSKAEIESNCCGLFGATGGDSITISDLNIENGQYLLKHKNIKLITNSISGYDNDGNATSAVGGVFSYVMNEGIVIENCHVKNVSFGSSSEIDLGDNPQIDFYVGGIVGLSIKGCTIRNCTVENVSINNSQDANPKLVDQFGGAIGRIEGGVKGTSSTYLIEHFKYDQGTTPLVFGENGQHLNNIRYGGLIANVTSKDKNNVSGEIKIYINYDTMISNVVFMDNPEKNLFAAGFLGSQRSAKSGSYFYIGEGCVIGGTIDNRVLGSYDANREINKYFSCSDSFAKNHQIEGTQTTCRNELKVISSNGKKTGFRKSSQTFFTND